MPTSTLNTTHHLGHLFTRISVSLKAHDFHLPDSRLSATVEMWGYAAILPVLSALTWLGMLLGMFLWWAVDQHTRILRSMADSTPPQKIAYISDIGSNPPRMIHPIC